MTKYYHHPTFVQYKKNHINLFPLYNMKKKSIREKKKKLKREKNKIGNILKGKKLKGKKLVVGLLGFCYALFMVLIITYFWVIPQIHFFSLPKNQKKYSN
jgi:hypothetical protein